MAPRATNVCERSRRWLITLNNYEFDEIEMYKNGPKSLTYCIGGLEVGLNGTPHIQGYCEFSATIRLSTLKRWLPRAHFEIARGSAKQNIDYCSKEDSVFHVFGEPSNPGGERRDVKRRYEEAKLAAREGRLEDIPADLDARYHNYYLAQYHSHRVVFNLVPGYKHEWFYGASRSGKSRTAREAYPNAYLKNGRTKWWDGYDCQEVVIIEDLDRKDADYMCYNLKIWLDHWCFPAECKGATLGVIRPRHVIITSNWRPEELWTEPQDLEPILNRIVIVEFPLALNLVYKKYNE